ncbi:MAG: DUF4199 domain-containing protein [Theionarchaea archaeon]|nr:MAG: hypothetical protein AYK18_10685 [Theionarchaea archaeon DG-70]MBU7011558.1 DUF4199 domain-containing protein [Theionarchaea archaeon]
MNCYYHPDRASVAQCVVCGKNLCSECNIIKEGQSYCRECLGVGEAHVDMGKILLPALGCGVLGAVLSIIPVVQMANIVCCLWIIVAGGLAVYVMKRFYNIVGKISISKAVLTGGLTGLVAGLIMAVFLIVVRGAVAPILEEMVTQPEFQEVLREFAMTEEEFTDLVMKIAVAMYLVLFPLFGALGGIISNELTK